MGESACKLINRIPGSCLLISSLPGSALRMHIESLGKLGDVNKRLKAFPVKLDIKRHSPSILYLVCCLIWIYLGLPSTRGPRWQILSQKSSSEV